MSDHGPPNEESLREDVAVPAEVGRSEEQEEATVAEQAVVSAPLWLRAVDTVVSVFLWTIVTVLAGICALMFLATVAHLTSQPATRSARLEMERRAAEIDRVIAAEEADTGREIAADSDESRGP